VPLALALVDYAFDSNLAGDPSGATATRDFAFVDENSGRAAANEAVQIGIRNGYSMQSAYLGGIVQPLTPGVWQDDGWNTAGDVHFVVSLLAPAARLDASHWIVHLLLEHTY
jgi:hypothetical protein